jgi:hypothetical protein
MSTSFLERLMDRATGKTPQIQIKPALTVDMIPQAYSSSENAYPTYPPLLGWEPADHKESNRTKIPSPPQNKSAPPEALASAENSNKQESTKQPTKTESPDTDLFTNVETDDGIHKENQSRRQPAKEIHTELTVEQPSLDSPTTKTSLFHAEHFAQTTAEPIYQEVNDVVVSPDVSITPKFKVQPIKPQFNQPAKKADIAYLLEKTEPEDKVASEAAQQNPFERKTEQISGSQISKPEKNLVDYAQSVIGLAVFPLTERAIESASKTNVTLREILTSSDQSHASKAGDKQVPEPSIEKAVIPDLKSAKQPSSLVSIKAKHEVELGPTVGTSKRPPIATVPNRAFKSPTFYPSKLSGQRFPSGQKEAESTVTIHIGRIEVHAAKEQEQPLSLPRAPVLSLKDYLKQRSEENQ